MDYPQLVQDRINFLKEYEVDEGLYEFDIFHLYPGKLAYPNGYYDSRWFNLVGFNTKEMKKRDLGRHDAVMYQGHFEIQSTQVYADGAFLISFNHPVYIESPFLQAVLVHR